jgi:uncharacterized OB-fold protein
MEGLQKGERGKVISFTTIHVTASDREVPYHIVFVELEKGEKVTGNILNGETKVDEVVRLAEVDQEGNYIFERF